MRDNSQFQAIQVVQEAAHLIQQQMKEEEREKSNAEEMDRQTDRHSEGQSSDRDSNIDNDNLISVNSNSDSSDTPPIQLLLEEIAGDNNATFL